MFRPVASWTAQHGAIAALRCGRARYPAHICGRARNTAHICGRARKERQATVYACADDDVFYYEYYVERISYDGKFLTPAMLYPESSLFDPNGVYWPFDKCLEARGAKPGELVELAEGLTKALCTKCLEVFFEYDRFPPENNYTFFGRLHGSRQAES